MREKYRYTAEDEKKKNCWKKCIGEKIEGFNLIKFGLEVLSLILENDN